MDILCPYGYTEKIKLGNIMLEYLDVTVFNGICDHCDLCKIKECEFYDDTREGTRRFMKAVGVCAASIDKQMEGEKKGERYRKRQKLGFRIIKGKG